MSRPILIVLALMAPIAACSSPRAGDLADSYQCIYHLFSIQSPAASAIDGRQEFNKFAVQIMADRISEPMKKALSIATDEAHAKISKQYGPQSFSMTMHFEEFVSNIGNALPKYIDIQSCESDTIAADELGKYVLYDIAINKYVSKIIGTGNVHQWFLENGGTYEETAMVAALIGLTLTHRKYELAQWKHFYTKHVEEKFGTS